MRRVLMVLGVLFMGLGLLVALYPFLSVWRVGDEVLTELPEFPEASQSDSGNLLGTAVFDDDFTVATRVYDGPSLQEVETALSGSGFEVYRSGSEVGWIKECCGDYDAVIVRLAQNGVGQGNGDEAGAGDGPVKADVTVFDSDIQASWPFFPVLGLFPGLIGLIMFVSGNRRSRPAVKQPDPATEGRSTLV